MAECTPIQHRVLGEGDLHGIANYTFATEQNRIDFSGPVTAIDRHKVAFVAESQQYYILIGTDPIQWGTFSVPYPELLSYDDVERQLILTLSNADTITTSLESIYTYTDNAVDSAIDTAVQNAVEDAGEYTDQQVAAFTDQIDGINDLIQTILASTDEPAASVTASYTITDHTTKTFITAENSGNITITLPSVSEHQDLLDSVEDGFKQYISRQAAGSVTFSPENSNVTVVNPLSTLAMENQGDVYLVVLKDFDDESVGETVWELVPLYLNAPEPEFGALAFLDTINDSALLDSMVVTEDALSEPVRQKLNRTAPNNFSATTDPTVDNDSTEGWEVGSVWINTTTLESYRALDVTEGAAQWMQTTLTTDELAEVAVSGSYNDLLDTPTLGTAAAANVEAFATATQGDKADTALQPGANISELTNNANYITAAGSPVQSVFERTGVVEAQAGDYSAGMILPETPSSADGTSWFITSAHHEKIFTNEGGTALNVQFGLASSYEYIPGQSTSFCKVDNSPITFSESTASVTVISSGGYEILSVGGWVTAIYLGNDVWSIVGDL